MKKLLFIILLIVPFWSIAQENKPVIILDGVALKTSINKSMIEKVSPTDLGGFVQPEDIQQIDVLKGSAAIEKYGEFLGKNGIILITRKSPSKTNIPKEAILYYENGKPLTIIDGEVIEGDFLKDISPDQIESVEVIKNDISYVQKYGPKALNGIIKITMKK